MPNFWKETFILEQPPLLNILTQSICLENSFKMVEFRLRSIIQISSLRQPSHHGSLSDGMAKKFPAFCNSLAQFLSSWPHHSVNLWTLWCLFQEKVLWAVQGGRCGWGSRGVRYIDKQYWLSIYLHFLKISISISISIRTFWVKNPFFSAEIRVFHAFLMKYRYRLSIYRLFLKYRWNIDTYFENIDIKKISIRKFGKYRYR